MPWGSPHPASGTVWHAGRVPCTGRGRVGKTAYPLKMITRRGLAALGSMGRLGCVVCASAIFLTTASVAHQLGGSVPAMTTSEVAEAVLGPPNAEESDWGGLFVMVTTRDCADCRVVQYEVRRRGARVPFHCHARAAQLPPRISPLAYAWSF